MTVFFRNQFQRLVLGFSLSLISVSALAQEVAPLPLDPDAPVQVDETIPTPIKVTLVAGKYSFDGVSTPVLKAKVGDTLVFDLSDATVLPHPFYIAEKADNKLAFAGAVHDTIAKTLTLTIDETTPLTLFYSCMIHKGMGGTGSIQIIPTPEVETPIETPIEARNVKVTLVTGKYSFDGVSTPVLSAKIGDVLVFDLSDATVIPHPFYLTEKADNKLAFAGAIADKIAKTLTLTVDESTPAVLFYSCMLHKGMGGTGSIKIEK